jgi:hypothetical protein
MNDEVWKERDCSGIPKNAGGSIKLEHLAVFVGSWVGRMPSLAFTTGSLPHNAVRSCRSKSATLQNSGKWGSCLSTVAATGCI